MPTQLAPHRIALALSSLLTITLAVYLRGLFGGFQFDDYPNIVENEFLLLAGSSWQSWWDAAFSSGAGLLRRPVSMLSFAINAHFNGMDPVVFKLFNVLIHLANGLLAYRLALLLIPQLASRTRQDQARSLHPQIAAWLIAAAWLLHPLQVSNVLYVVQRMNLLAAFFTLAALLCYTSLRLRQQTLGGYQPLRLLGLAVFTVLAVLSKENGALVPAFILVIELFCFRFGAMRRRDALAVRWGLLLVVVVPALLALAYAVYRHDWMLAGYAIRDFDLTDRLLTQARMLWHYLLWSLLPNPHWMGLYHDDIPYSTQLTTPWSTLPAIIGLAGLLYAAWRFRQSRPGLSFAIAWFLAGHLLESTVLPLEMVFEHRQYLPLYGILLGLVASLSWPVQQGPRALALAASALLLLSLALLTAQRSWTWGDPVRLALATAQDHPDSPRSLYDAGRVLVEQQHPESEKAERLNIARIHLAKAMQLSPGYVHPAVTMAMTYQADGIVPPALLTEITQRISQTYLLSPLPELLLIRTAAAGRLKISPEAMAGIVEAMLANKSVDALTRGLVLSNYGNYLARYANDPQAAIAVSLAAIEIEPRYALFQLNAAYLAERLGQAEIAIQHLRNAELLDVTGIYQIEITTLRSKLESQTADSPAP